MPTSTLEEYLETIYKQSQDGVVRPSRIAEAIGVSGPTVTATLKRLESRGLVFRRGTEVLLTPEGVAESLDIVRRHRLAERFLVDVLGLDWDAAHEEACLLEHALSPRVLAALERFLGDPSVCPHGHPIPAADGSVSHSPGQPLDALSVGDRAVVLRVSEEETTLGYLGQIGLKPGAKVSLIAREPLGGPLSIEIDGEVRPVSADVARLVTVECAP
ncbi:MAG: metal-dependent transcriptional regulator [Coriobacteriia bacterium]|nr:metal-dependent transcriptional regulator [Coriobacteriia bacterium]